MTEAQTKNMDELPDLPDLPPCSVCGAAWLDLLSYYRNQTRTAAAAVRCAGGHLALCVVDVAWRDTWEIL